MLKFQQALYMQQTTGMCPLPVADVISGWGQYSDNIDSLPPDQRGKVDQLADLIVTSFAHGGCQPLRKVTIVGHADKDWHGAEAEKSVSIQRANAVAVALTQAVRMLWTGRKMGPPPPGGVEVQRDGVGASQMIAGPYHRANRRVVVTANPAGPVIPPPFTWRDAAERGLSLLDQPLGGKLPKDQRDRLKCALGKVLQDGTKDAYMLWEDFKNLDGTRPPPNPDQWVNRIVHHLRTDLGVRDNYGPQIGDSDFVGGLVSWDDNITRTLRNINKVISATQAGGGASAVILPVWRVIFDFIDRLIVDDKQVLSCYYVYWRGLPWNLPWFPG